MSSTFPSRTAGPITALLADRDEALGIADSRAGSIDLVVTDVVIPDLTLREALDAPVVEC